MYMDRAILLDAAVLCLLTLSGVSNAAGQMPEQVNEARKSSAQIEWEKKLSPQERTQPGFAFVEENPKLPRVLLIGDSISIGYTPVVREQLKGKANVLRIPANGGPTSTGVTKLDEWLGKGKWDVIHFNWGLHDIKRMNDGKLDGSGEWQVSAEQYEKNLEQLVRRLKATGASLIWATTTPVPDGAGGRTRGDEVKVNDIAAKVMTKHRVPVDDLYARVAPRLAEFQTPKNVHFTEEGYAFLGEQAATEIETALRARSGAGGAKG